MPWKEVSLMSQRKELVLLAWNEGSNISMLCRQFGISRKTAYKWMERFELGGPGGLADKPRAPFESPARTPLEMEKLVVALRDKHPAWGGRKLHARLAALGHEPPAPSTITNILRRHHRLNPAQSAKHKPWRRFEHAEPNALWQMDFKGDFALTRGGRCHPLTIIDDHSRYALCILACADQRRPTVQNALIQTFETYGLPERMLMDNGSCWGHDDNQPFTKLTVWLIRHGVSICHGRSRHPQTQGKDERFNRTLKLEVISTRPFRDLTHCQNHFDQWRAVYNLERPHESLDMRPPISRYRQSRREYTDTLPPIEYAPGDIVRKVSGGAAFNFKNQRFRLGKAFIGLQIALRPTTTDGLFDVYLSHQKIDSIDMRRDAPVLTSRLAADFISCKDGEYNL